MRREYPKKNKLTQAGPPTGITEADGLKQLEAMEAEYHDAVCKSITLVRDVVVRMFHTRFWAFKFPTWAIYCEQRLKMSRRNADRIIAHADAVDDVKKMLSWPEEAGRASNFLSILTSPEALRVVAKAAPENREAVAREIADGSDAVPIKVRARIAAQRHKSDPKPAKPRTKKVEASARAVVLMVGNTLATAAGEYGDADLYNCVCAAVQQLRSVKARLR